MNITSESSTVRITAHNQEEPWDRICTEWNDQFYTGSSASDELQFMFSDVSNAAEDYLNNELVSIEFDYGSDYFTVTIDPDDQDQDDAKTALRNAFENPCTTTFDDAVYKVVLTIPEYDAGESISLTIHVEDDNGDESNDISFTVEAPEDLSEDEDEDNGEGSTENNFLDLDSPIADSVDNSEWENFTLTDHSEYKLALAAAQWIANKFSAELEILNEGE